MLHANAMSRAGNSFQPHQIEAKQLVYLVGEDKRFFVLASGVSEHKMEFEVIEVILQKKVAQER